MNLDAIGIVSKNIDETLRFFSLLGVQIKPDGGDGHYEGATASGTRLMVDTLELMKQINPNWQEPKGSNVVLAFRQESPAGVDKTHSALKDAGFTESKAPWDAFWGQRYSSIMSPDGFQVDLFADQPN